MKTASVLTLAFLLAACGGGDDDGDPGAPDGGGDDPLPEPGEPILDRDSPGTHACEVLDEPAEVAGDTMSAAVADVGGAPLVARSSYGMLGADEYGFILGVTPASFDPMGLGDESYRRTGQDILAIPALVSAGEGALMAWDDRVAGSVMLARLDASGEVVGTPASVAEVPSVTAIALTTRHLTWIAGGLLYVQPLGEDGAPSGEPGLVREEEAMLGNLALAPVDGGAAVVWTQHTEDAGVYLAMVDGSGELTAGPLRISGTVAASTNVTDPTVLAAGDELLVAWTEYFANLDVDGDPETWDPAGHAIIRVARVSGDGERVLALERLQDVEEEVIHIQPSLVAQGDAVALSWSRGMHIAVCGGCISDNRRRLVVLEPHDLVPLSQPIEMEGVTGFSRGTMAAVAGDLVHLLGLDYHAISTLALARTRCAEL